MYEPMPLSAVKGRESVGIPIMKGTKRFNMLLAVRDGMVAAIDQPGVAASERSLELADKDYTLHVKVMIPDRMLTR